MTTHQSKTPLHFQAFSLVEMAIALVILGIIGHLTHKAFLAGSMLRQQRITEARQSEIDQALTAFLAQNNRLPCPSDRSLNGRESPDSNFKCSLNPGTVPFAALGLPQNAQFDGTGRLFLYAVHGASSNSFASQENRKRAPLLSSSKLPSFSSKTLRMDQFCRLNPKQSPVVKRAASHLQLLSSHPQHAEPVNVAYVLISYGLEGWSPFDQKVPNTKATEQENDKKDLIFVEGDDIIIRHKVLWKTVPMLALEAYGRTCLQESEEEMDVPINTKLTGARLE